MTNLHPNSPPRVRTSPWRRWLIPALAVLLASLPARGLDAQLLRVHAVEDASGRPAAGAIVEVMDESGQLAGQVVLGADGRREVILVRPGTFRVRLRRIGYPPYVSQPFTMTTAPFDLRLTVPARRVALAAVEVTAARCAGDAFTHAGVGALWDEIHTALTSTSLGHDETSTVFEIRAFRRTLGRDGRIRAIEVGLPRTMTAPRPYRAVSPRELARHGYIQPSPADSVLLFHGPDEDVLRSNEFVASHCFSVVRGTGPRAGLFGMRFAPARQRTRRDVNDIAGTLWIDSATAELRHVDFHYVSSQLPRAAQGEQASGGQVVFQRLPSGRWIVGAWKLRLPRMGNDARQPVDGYDEYGGVVTPRDGASTSAPAALAEYHALLAPGSIDGTVFDSLAMRPLVGARVWLVPIEPPATVRAGLVTAGALNVSPTSMGSDSAGRWRLPDITPGMYRIGFEHPAVDSLGVALRWPELRLAPGDALRLQLSIPSLATLGADCEPTRDRPRPEGGIVVGVVRGVSGGPPPAGTVVRASWQDWSPVARDVMRAVVLEAYDAAQADGSYRLCGVPRGVPLEVRATTPTDTTPSRTVQVAASGLARQHLRFMQTPDSGAAAANAPTPADADLVARHAEADPGAALARVHWRRIGGLGYTLVGDSLRRHPTLPSALRALPGVRLTADQRIGGPWVVTLESRGAHCAARVFVDGAEVDFGQLQRIRPAALAAVELFVDPARTPIFATGAASAGAVTPCGTLLLWTAPTPGGGGNGP